MASQGRRLRDPRLAELIQALQQQIDSGAEPDAPADGQPATPREAARALVALAGKTESLAVVDACRREVERLAALPEDARPYDCDSLRPAALGLLGE